MYFNSGHAVKIILCLSPASAEHSCHLPSGHPVQNRLGRQPGCGQLAEQPFHLFWKAAGEPWRQQWTPQADIPGEQPQHGDGGHVIWHWMEWHWMHRFCLSSSTWLGLDCILNLCFVLYIYLNKYFIIFRKNGVFILSWINSVL